MSASISTPVRADLRDRLEGARPARDAKSDFDIFKLLARAWGCDDLFSAWTDAEAGFRMLQRVSKGKPCDISRIEGYQMLIEREGVQWPYPQEAAENQEYYAQPHRRLFEDGRFFTPNVRARFLHDPIAELPEVPDEEYPHVLITGRGSVFQFHTQTRTGKVPFIRSKSHPRGYVQVNAEDAVRLGPEHEGRLRSRLHPLPPILLCSGTSAVPPQPRLHASICRRYHPLVAGGSVGTTIALRAASHTTIRGATHMLLSLAGGRLVFA